MTPHGPRRPSLRYEAGLWRRGCMHVAGLDEVGRGAWAGPLVAAAVVLPAGRDNLARMLRGVRDSKVMTPAGRDRWAEAILAVALAWAVGSAAPGEVDDLGPLGATRLAMQRALDALAVPPDHLLIDYLRLPECPLPQTALPRGDARMLSVAAASVVAKVWRDRVMMMYDENFPEFGLARNKGYGTPEHRRALERLGPTPLHRLSYHPVAQARARLAPPSRDEVPKPAH
ncbi:MAG TPA: ribonuclease HII [Anaerolineales bacterium]|nr:ribonuclease HII [Anaerolineales bacterium]